MSQPSACARITCFGCERQRLIHIKRWPTQWALYHDGRGGQIIAHRRCAALLNLRVRGEESARRIAVRSGLAFGRGAVHKIFRTGVRKLVEGGVALTSLRGVR